MSSFIRTPKLDRSIVSNSIPNIIIAYDIIEEYLADSNIDFDLFQYTKSPNFANFVHLINLFELNSL